MSKVHLYTVKEIAEYLSVHEITIYRMLKANKIPALRLGGQWRFDIASVTDWLSQGSDSIAIPRDRKRAKRKTIPKFLWKYFWDVNAKKINLCENGEFVLERILEYGDVDSVEWLKKSFTIDEIRNVVKNSRRLSPRSANYWRLILGIKKEDVSCLRESSQKRRGKIWKH